MQELQKRQPLHFVIMMSGQVYGVFEPEMVAILQAMDQNKSHYFIKSGAFKGNTITLSGVEAIEDERTYEQRKNLKSGKFKCDHGVWHDKGTQCTCWAVPKEIEYKSEWREGIPEKYKKMIHDAIHKKSPERKALLNKLAILNRQLYGDSIVEDKSRLEAERKQVVETLNKID